MRGELGWTRLSFLFFIFIDFFFLFFSFIYKNQANKRKKERKKQMNKRNKWMTKTLFFTLVFHYSYLNFWGFQQQHNHLQLKTKHQKKKQLAKVWWGWRNWGCLQAKRKVSSKTTLSLSFSFYREGGEVGAVFGGYSSLQWSKSKKGHMMFFCFCFCCFFVVVVVLLCDIF